MWKRLTLLWTLVRGDLRLLWRALRHPLAPWWLKAGTLALVVYLVLPVDLLPDLIPVLGLADDVALVALVVHWMVSRLPPALRAQLQTPPG
jgi:uncharacterized membrane protein YkvA (DUF1232 family)